jgi:branched-chain amino acid transport system ATP-binding protein
LEVASGEVHGLIGPNGAGKTTLFNVITGLQRPTQGRVKLGDQDVTGAKPHVRARRGLGRTFQRLELFGTLSARENVQMAAEVQRNKLTNGRSPIEEAEFQLERVGILHIADEPTDSLPTGLARLVEMARALATSPTVLLLDEPSSGLNAEETHGLGEVLQQLAAEGMGVLLVEHDMALVMNICDYVHVLDFGTKIFEGTTADVSSSDPVRAAYLGTAYPGTAYPGTAYPGTAYPGTAYPGTAYPGTGPASQQPQPKMAR